MNSLDPEDLLAERAKTLREIDERLERVAVELCRLNVANRTLEQLRLDLRGWVEQAEAEYANF